MSLLLVARESRVASRADVPLQLALNSKSALVLLLAQKVSKQHVTVSMSPRLTMRSASVLTASFLVSLDLQLFFDALSDAQK